MGASTHEEPAFPDGRPETGSAAGITVCGRAGQGKEGRGGQGRAGGEGKAGQGRASQPSSHSNAQKSVAPFPPRVTQLFPAAFNTIYLLGTQLLSRPFSQTPDACIQ